MGNLYVVATPIGNLEDITIRAARILLASKTIVAESSSKADILLNYLKQKFPEFEKNEHKIMSYAESEELNKIPQVIKLLEQSDVSLISEAGTPLISDPGYKLVAEAVKREINVIPIPGVTAATAALSASGLPSDKFLFLGFLPRQNSKKRKLLENSKQISSTVIIYESPHRITETLQTIYDLFGNIDIVIARELTKVHEEFIRGKIEEILNIYKKRQPKGEITILF